MDAVLYPHRSLSPTGFLILMGTVASVSFSAGFMFLSMGAWPIFGFFGLDVALLYLAFRINYRRGRVIEHVKLSRRALTVTRVEPDGRTAETVIEPYWVRVAIDDPPRHESQLTLTSHGRTLTLGSFLAPDERGDFADALRRALVKVRQPAGLDSD